MATEGFQEAHFAMARKDAVYFYSTDGRGQCYAIEGEKCHIFWFRNYLVIVTRETPMWARNSADMHKGILEMIHMYRSSHLPIFILSILQAQKKTSTTCPFLTFITNSLHIQLQ